MGWLWGGLVPRWFMERWVCLAIGSLAAGWGAPVVERYYHRTLGQLRTVAAAVQARQAAIVEGDQ